MIIRLIKERYHLIVGFKTAEYIKLELASAIPKNNREIRVHGRDLITGLPGNASIPQRLVFDAMKDYLLEVIEAIREMVEKIPPEMMHDILANGIYFTGGTTLIPALDKIMSSALQVKIMFSQRPMESTIRGLGGVMENPSEYKNMVFSLKSAALQ
jgi:rod shape-determining protein MreB